MPENTEFSFDGLNIFQQILFKPNSARLCNRHEVFNFFSTKAILAKLQSVCNFGFNLIQNDFKQLDIMFCEIIVNKDGTQDYKE